VREVEWKREFRMCVCVCVLCLRCAMDTGLVMLCKLEDRYSLLDYMNIYVMLCTLEDRYSLLDT
jgi:hypothetical protein